MDKKQKKNLSNLLIIAFVIILAGGYLLSITPVVRVCDGSCTI